MVMGISSGLYCQIEVTEWQARIFGLGVLQAKCILVSRHSMIATIVDLRYHMKDVLRAIDRGETVTVLYRGKEKARLTPIAPTSGASGKGAPKTKDQPLFGLWNDRDDLADPASYLRNLRPRPLLPQARIKKQAGARKPR